MYKVWSSRFGGVGRLTRHRLKEKAFLRARDAVSAGCSVVIFRGRKTDSLGLALWHFEPHVPRAKEHV